jgi:hypothetical protein
MITEFELISLSENHSPIFFTNLLSEQYYSNYCFSGNSVDSSRNLVNDFYKMHYGGKNIPNDMVNDIANKYGFNLPLVITCIYLIDIEDNLFLRNNCIANLNVLYKIVKTAHNENCPMHKRSLYVPCIEEMNQIIEILEIDYDMGKKLKEKEESDSPNFKNLVEKFIEMQYVSEDKSPYDISKIITNLYQNKVESEFDFNVIHAVVEASSEFFLSEKDFLTELQIMKIVTIFRHNVPMIAFCIYFQLHKNSEADIESRITDREIIYKIIVDGYNKITKTNRIIDYELDDKDFEALMNILFE